MTTPLFINAIGHCNPLGGNAQEVAEKLFSGTRSAFIKRSDLLANGQPIYVAPVSFPLPDADGAPHFVSRNNQLVTHAYQQIAGQVARLKERYGASRIAVVVGSSTSGIAEAEVAMQGRIEQGQFPADYHYRKQELSNLAEYLQQLAGVSGPCLTISTACTSSAKSFLTAQEMIQAGLVDAAIVGGADSLCGMTVNGFFALDSTADELCHPFSKNRDGINIGEAATLAVLSKQPAQLMLLGGGESSDAHHMSAPHPEGEGAIKSMQLALANAGLDAEDIGYINLHGTATQLNDRMEAIAVKQVFGNTVPVSSTKGAIGHTLGAAGATELAFCALMLKAQCLAPHLWDGQADEQLPMLNLVEKAQSGAFQYCLSNSFAFGGNNVSLILGYSHE